MRVCPSCESEFDEDAEGCPHCGGAAAVVRCEGCGEEYAPSDACPACGRGRLEFACGNHPEKPAQGRCVICGRALCSECRKGDGRAFLCERHYSVTVIQGWAQVYSTTSEFEAQLLKDNLLAEDLDARIFSQKDNMLSVDLGELSIVRLLVPVWEYEQGARVIRQHMDEEGEVTFACPSCGEAYEPGAESCASCGAELAPTLAD